MNVSNWLVKDYDLHMGGDLNTKNDPFSSEKRLVVIGPQIAFNVPIGFFNVAFDYSHEWNHNGFLNAAEDFKPAFEIEAAWGIPFTIGQSALTFKGFFNYVAPKGTGAVGEHPRVAEILTRPELMLDVGNYWGSKGKLEVGVGYEYWMNKFGNDPKYFTGVEANTPELIARYHF